MIPITSNRGMNASDLYKKTDTGVLADVIAEQIKTIDGEIVAAHSAGMDRISHELPSNFNINNIPVIDAQTLVYSELIAIYSADPPIGKGYPRVTIETGPKSYLNIGWVNGLNAEEIRERKQFIQTHRVVPRTRPGRFT